MFSLNRYRSVLAALLLATAICVPFASASTIDWQVTAYADGAHNAFTDLAFWRGNYYLCFRHGTGHVSMDGEIRIMRSADMKTWEPVTTIKTFGDDRDPHFTVTEERLWVHFGTWDLRFPDDSGLPDRGVVRSHAVNTEDGETWSDVRALYEPGWWLWRVREHEGTFYSLAYTAERPRPGSRETILLRSQDGWQWEFVSQVTDERMTGEADMWFNEDGSIWMITRTGDEAGDAARFDSDPSLMKWTRQDLGVLIHAPVIAEWKGRFFVAGRGRTNDKYDTQIWESDGAEVRPLLTLPSGGDTSYPGMLLDPATADADAPSFFVTWYSQHETSERHESNVYAARVTLTP